MTEGIWNRKWAQNVPVPLRCTETRSNRLLKRGSLAALASSLAPSFTVRKLQSSLLAALPSTHFQQPANSEAGDDETKKWKPEQSIAGHKGGSDSQRHMTEEKNKTHERQLVPYPSMRHLSHDVIDATSHEKWPKYRWYSLDGHGDRGNEANHQRTACNASQKQGPPKSSRCQPPERN